MTWLRPYDCDPSLPSRAGEPALAPPPAAEVLAHVRGHLVLPGSMPAASARLEFARWKPSVSITAGYSIGFEDGTSAQVTLKRYRDSKGSAIAEGFQPDDRARRLENRLRSFAALPDGHTCLYAFPADRVLPGVARLLHLRRTARLLNSIPFDRERRVRGSRSQARVLRYKPERRAVLRLDLALCDTAGLESRILLAARALPPEQAARVLAFRRAALEHGPSGEGPIAPRLVLVEERTGLLFEEWLDVDVPLPASFDHARPAGATLARLHAPASGLPALLTADPYAELRPLFAVDSRLAAHAARLAAPPPLPASGWIHGDLHPDQVVRERASGRTRLLDLDSLGPGRPAADLAMWAADHLAARPDLDLAAVVAPLLAGYEDAGGFAPPVPEIASRTAVELVRRAAAGLRRLERGAVERGLSMIERSRELAGASRVRS